MSKTPVSILLHPDLEHAAEALAREQDISIGQLIRNLLAREISKARAARPPVRADERLVAPLRARFATDFASAKSWSDLQARLKAKGYSLHAAGGGLALHSWPDGGRVCKASELGFSYSKLMRRLRAPFPGHSHTWLFDRVSRDDDVDDEEEIEVIERW